MTWRAKKLGDVLFSTATWRGRHVECELEMRPQDPRFGQAAFLVFLAGFARTRVVAAYTDEARMWLPASGPLEVPIVKGLSQRLHSIFHRLVPIVISTLACGRIMHEDHRILLNWIRDERDTEHGINRLDDAVAFFSLIDLAHLMAAAPSAAQFAGHKSNSAHAGPFRDLEAFCTGRALASFPCAS